MTDNNAPADLFALAIKARVAVCELAPFHHRNAVGALNETSSALVEQLVTNEGYVFGSDAYKERYFIIDDSINSRIEGELAKSSKVRQRELTQLFR